MAGGEVLLGGEDLTAHDVVLAEELYVAVDELGLADRAEELPLRHAVEVMRDRLGELAPAGGDGAG